MILRNLFNQLNNVFILFIFLFVYLFDRIKQNNFKYLHKERKQIHASSSALFFSHAFLTLKKLKLQNSSTGFKGALIKYSHSLFGTFLVLGL